MFYSDCDDDDTDNDEDVLVDALVQRNKSFQLFKVFLVFKGV